MVQGDSECSHIYRDSREPNPAASLIATCLREKSPLGHFAISQHMSTNRISMQIYAVVSGSTAYVVCPVRVLKQEGLLERSPSYSLSRRLKSYDVTMNLFQLLIQKQEIIFGVFAMFASMYRKECDECGGFPKVSQNMRCDALRYLLD